MNIEEIKTSLSNLPHENQIAILSRLEWLSTARKNQIPKNNNNSVNLWLAGRGFGKTRTAVEDLWWDCWTNEKIRYGVVCATANDTRKTAFDGESGIIARCPPEIIEYYNKSLLEIKLINGSIIQGFTADEPSRLRGAQFHRAWIDELATWRYQRESWDMLMFCLRLGDRTKLNITTTPQPTLLIKELIKRDDINIYKGSTFDNKENLSKQQLDILIERYENTRIGRQELYAEVLEDIEGALWSYDMLDRARKSRRVSDYKRVVIAIDPAVSNNKNSDETGIIVCAKDTLDNYIILDDKSGSYSPSEWANVAINLYRKYNADVIIGEVNNGGDLIESNIRNIDNNINFKQVRATRGKVIRAEPISALYEQDKVYHITRFAELEEQMTSFTGDSKQSSPDRLDALVWGLTHLSEKNTEIFVSMI